MTYIRKDYATPNLTPTTDLMWADLLGTASAVSTAYLVSRKSSSRITQFAAAALAFHVTFSSCLLYKIKKTAAKSNANFKHNEQVDRLLYERVKVARYPSEEKIQAAWRRFQAFPWYPEILREVQFPPADIIGSEQGKIWERTRASGVATDEEAWVGISRDNFKGGNCAGITNAIVHALIANPYASELQVLSSIDGEDIAYYQLLNNCLRDAWGTRHDEAKLTSEKVIASLREVKPKIWETSRKSYKPIPISLELKPHTQYVQEILKEKPSLKSVMIGKIRLYPGHVMGFEIFPNDEWRIFENGRPICGTTIETFASSLRGLSHDHKRTEDIRICAVFV